MCGFVVVAGRRRQSILQEAVDRAIQHVAERGPDGCRTVRVPGAALGSCRLALWDVGDARQPARSVRHVGAFNGEVFNAVDVQHRLAPTAAPMSEIELIVSGIASHGPDWLNELDGQFAIAVYGIDERELVLTRDRWGICPLFYAGVSGHVVAASTIRAVIAGIGATPPYRPSALTELGTMWRPYGGGTAFEGIGEVPPGSFVRIREGTVIEVGTWAQPTAVTAVSRSAEDLDGTIDSALCSAIVARSRGPHRPGLLLSGGVDSALIATYAVELGAHISYGLHVDDSTLMAQLDLAARLGLEHRSVRLEPERYVDALVDYVRTNAVPVTRSGPLAMFELGKAVASDAHRMLLSGEGADELFFGYDSYKRARLTRSLARFPTSSRLRRAAAAVGETDDLRALNSRGAVAFWDLQAEGILPSSYRTEPVAYLSHFLRRDHQASIEHRRQELLAEGLARQAQESNLLRAVQRYEVDTLLGGYLLQSQSDHAFATHGVEVRFPFLADLVAEVASTAPIGALMVGLSEKLPLRRVLASRLGCAADRLPRRSAFRVGLAPLFGNDSATRQFLDLVLAAPDELFDVDMLRRLSDRIARRKTASERETTTLLIAASYAVLRHELRRTSNCLVSQ